MAQYWQEDDFGYSIKEKKNLFKCHMNDLDVTGNRTWKYENILGQSCNIPKQIETKQNVLICQVLVNWNRMISYLPTYSELYNHEIKEQMYTSKILCENLKLSLVPM